MRRWTLLSPLIDLHCHLLPGVDDGPKDLADSLILAQSLVEKGFSHAVATPHYLEDYSRDCRRNIEGAYTQLTQALRAAGVPLTVYLGGELLVIPALMDLARERQLPTLNGTRYVLLELPLYQPLPLYMEDVFFALQARGYIPVLAHPERMDAFRDKVHMIYKLVSKGILVQVNLGSLAGVYGPAAKRLARGILKNGLAAFVASDSHDAALPELIKGELKKPSFPGYLLCENPQKALRDEGIAVHAPKPSLSLRGKAKNILNFF